MEDGFNISKNSDFLGKQWPIRSKVVAMET